jgi:hypothetical protein
MSELAQPHSIMASTPYAIVRTTQHLGLLLHFRLLHDYFPLYFTDSSINPAIIILLVFSLIPTNSIHP